MCKPHTTELTAWIRRVHHSYTWLAVRQWTGRSRRLTVNVTRLQAATAQEAKRKSMSNLPSPDNMMSPAVLLFALLCSGSSTTPDKQHRRSAQALTQDQSDRRPDHCLAKDRNVAPDHSNNPKDELKGTSPSTTTHVCVRTPTFCAAPPAKYLPASPRFYSHSN